ncbi:unnamed protein product [Rotaria magnacalcarata]|uniref:Uncharacterized protein n=1 Tax=Rotaria magnacalcarata TaxID=392030 RepID=A0A815RIC8_9BILA|nr:unnamed protein product [Rotaria magnacalcarata]
MLNIPGDVRWTQKGITVVGGHRYGSLHFQLYYPLGLCVDDDQTVALVDQLHHRIVQWKKGDNYGHVIAGGKGSGNELNQLKYPTDILSDQETDRLIVCDRGNRRILQWSLRRGTEQGELLIDNITYYELVMNNQRYRYVSDIEKHAVRRYQLGTHNGTVVAGGNGEGVYLNQLNIPDLSFCRSTTECLCIRQLQSSCNAVE